VGFAAFLKPLLSDGALSGWFKELVAIRVGFLNRCEYCVSAHTLSARQKGAAEEKIRAVTGDFESGPFSESEKAAFRCAGILHISPQGVDDAFFSELKRFYTEPQLVELFATIGAFEMFPRLVDGLRIPVTPPPAISADKKG
jgi:AhpD family alkylhydroperoxidase